MAIAPNAPARTPPRRPAVIKLAVTAYDVAAAVVAMYLGIILRFAMSPDLTPPHGLAVTASSLFGLAALLVFTLQGLQKGVWRFTSLNDVMKIAYAVGVANLLFLVVLFFINRLVGLPRSSLAIEAPLLFFLLIAARFARQIYSSGDWRSAVRLEDRRLPVALLVGRHVALDVFLRDIARRPGGPPFRIRGLIEPDGAERGRSIRGYPVLGGAREAESALISLAGANGAAPQLVLVDATLRRDQIDEFVSAAHAAAARFVRANVDLAEPSLSPLEAADLLSRQPRRLDLSGPRRLVHGQRILVTGAGGTIGSELTRQIVRFEPAHLTLIEASEFNLYEIDLALRESGFRGGIDARLGDVRDQRRLDDIFAEAEPDVVIHAAALKHVPLMEKNVTEATLTNVLGTINAATAARDHGAKRFVLISTDKAVSPTNVMGASKRAAELFVQALDRASDSFTATLVRFGNVLGSAGSVVPLFERQIKNGGPITVTHEEMTRYFMTVDEAAALVLQAAANDPADRGPGGVFVLDMGESVKIEHLARQLCRLRGYEPDRDIAIVHTGLRDGEKLNEQLFYDTETVAKTDVDGVLLAATPTIPLDELTPKLDALIAAAQARNRAKTIKALADLIPEFEAADPAAAPTREDGGE